MSTEMMITVGLAAVVLALLAVTMGIVLGWANKAFHVSVDPRIDAINEALPGANCGGCGFVGCNDFAEALVNGGCTDIGLCGPGGASCSATIAGILGVEVSEAAPYRAVVHCSAVREDRLHQREYRGESTCAAANLVTGIQGCVYGCLGYGDCEMSCKYDAIQIVDGLARINYEKCIGCKACSIVCPRNIISMVPFKAEEMLVVACSNQDIGLEVKAVCKTGCIGCSACTRKVGEQPIKMADGYPMLDYDDYDPDTIDVKLIRGKCKRASLLYVGVPSEEDKAMVAHEETPDVAQADFKTTVDKTDYRG